MAFRARSRKFCIGGLIILESPAVAPEPRDGVDRRVEGFQEVRNGERPPGEGEMRFQDIYPSVDRVFQDGLFEYCRYAPFLGFDDTVFRLNVNGPCAHRRLRVRARMMLHEASVLQVGLDVGIRDDVGHVELRQEVESPARPHGLVLHDVLYLHPEAGAVLEVVHDEVRLVVEAEPDLPEPLVPEAVDNPLDDGLGAYREERFGSVVSEGAEAETPSSGHQNDGSHRVSAKIALNPPDTETPTEVEFAVNSISELFGIIRYGLNSNFIWG